MYFVNVHYGSKVWGLQDLFMFLKSPLLTKAAFIWSKIQKKKKYDYILKYLCEYIVKYHLILWLNLYV